MKKMEITDKEKETLISALEQPKTGTPTPESELRKVWKIYDLLEATSDTSIVDFEDAQWEWLFKYITAYLDWNRSRLARKRLEPLLDKMHKTNENK